ncbi:MAG TPA: transglycosylase domain-containing protein [Herpetosiphonaceae bacterium]|nr:transglycosylase domain-containing protein [Herpetosiphonaceae bacterium]
MLGAVLGLLLLIPGVALGVGGVVYADTAQTLKPRLDTLASYHEQAFQTSRIFDRNGRLLYEFVNAGRRDPVTLDQISPMLIDATISVEDKTFYDNVGVDYLGLLKAVYRNLMSGAEVSGGSTITQQLIKLVVLNAEERDYENRYRRKFTEIILAQQIGSEYTKDQILELYLNEINYGNLAYGIQAAAKSYFGANANELNLNQASLLAGLPQQPTLYNPINFVEDGRILRGVQLKRGWLNPGSRLPNGTTLPRARQVDVLRQMVLNGKISQREAEGAIAQNLEFVSQDVPIHAPHFVFHVKQVLEQDPIIGPMLVNEGGLNITTTLDLRIQDIAQAEAARRIQELEQEQRNIHNAAVVVMQPRTGQILAMVGSVDYNRTQATNTPGEEGNVLDGNVNVTTRDRQPGSALKPFTYLSALEQGKLSPGSVLWDVETKFPIKEEEATKENLDDPELWYGPKNFDLKWHGPIRMRESLAGSLNMPAVKALRRAGIRNTLDLLHRVGITGLNNTPEYYGLALTLGGGEVTPLDLTTAYNTLASDGTYTPAQPVLQITDRGGNVLPFSRGEPQPAVDPKYVAIVRDFMGDNDARAPIFGRDNPLKLSRPAHVKTGTTEDFRDAWAVGYTPYVTVGVWTGNNNNEKTAKVESTTGGGVIWNRIMETLFKDPELERLLRGPDLSVPLQFPDPTTFGVEKRKVCKIGGAFGQRDSEWFVPGQGDEEANAECNLYTTISAVRDEDGKLCRPAQGVSYGDRLMTFKVWSLPPSTEEEHVVKATWDGGSIEGAPLAAAPEEVCGRDVASVPQPGPTQDGAKPAAAQPTPARNTGVGQPKPTPRPSVEEPKPAPPPPVEEPKPAPPPPAQVIPSLVGLGENQARGVLAGLGITNVVVDYQGPDRLGDLYNTTPAYVVVSHSPGPGTPVSAGMSVVLGIRAP